MHRWKSISFNQPGHRMSSLTYSCGARLTRAPCINVRLCDSHHRVTPLHGVGLKPCQTMGPLSFSNEAVRNHGTGVTGIGLKCEGAGLGAAVTGH